MINLSFRRFTAIEPGIMDQPPKPAKSAPAGPSAETLPGFCHLPGAIDIDGQRRLIAFVFHVIDMAPLYRPTMPKTGKPFSVAMTNCGDLGWVSDVRGYRYQPRHPVTGRPWPPIPADLIDLWQRLAAYPALPQACLVNHYVAGAKLGSHVDGDEDETSAPVLSISLGDTAIFHVGGLKRADPKSRMTLRSGDIVILGGQARLAYHGLDRILPATSDLVPFGGRINLTLRRVTRDA